MGNKNQFTSFADALRQGKTPQEMCEDFLAELQEAIDEVSAEQEWTDLDDARLSLVDALVDYAVALGIADEELMDDDDFTDALFIKIKEQEQNVKEMKSFMGFVAECGSAVRNAKDADDAVDKAEKVIRKFVKSL